MWQIQSFTFSPLAENTYLLWNENRHAIIIDPGCYTTYEKQTLQSFINEQGLLPKLLLNTHCHIDHVFGEKWVAETWNLVPHIHFNEQWIMQHAEAFAEAWALPFTNYSGPFVFIKEGELIKLEEAELQVLYVPGHSPGHICFYCPQQQFVIAGDTLFASSIGRTDLPGGDHATLIEAIKTQLLTLPEETVVYSGHGPATNIEKEKMNNPYLRR